MAIRRLIRIAATAGAAIAALMWGVENRARAEDRAVGPWDRHGTLRASEDGRRLAHADGTPFLWLGDTAWALHQNLSREDVLLYLDDCAANGFTVIQFMSVNAWALRDWKNHFGEPPYRDGKARELNLPFWQHLGWVIDEAARRGLYVLLVYGSPGRTDNHGPVTGSPEEAYAYGRALGAFLRDKPNLIWSGGIDVNPDDPKRVSPMGMAGWHAMAEGVTDGVAGADRFDGEADWAKTLMTYHPRGNSTSSAWFHDAPWLDFIGTQIGLRGDTLLRTVRADYAREPTKPVVNLEPWYEQCTWKKPPVDEWEVRLQAYQAAFAGVAGVTYGHMNIYQFDSPGEAGGFRWRDCLKAPGRLQMKHLLRLAGMVPWHAGVPLPTIVTAAAGDAPKAMYVTTRIAAVGAEDGSWVCVYSPAGAPFSVDLPRLRGESATARWFDPRTGGGQEIGTVPTGVARRFIPPCEPGPGQDWVLVLTSEGE